MNFLEIQYDYKLCIHERDFALGSMILSNIMAAIEHSRRVILIISRYAILNECSDQENKQKCLVYSFNMFVLHIVLIVYFSPIHSSIHYILL